jgi:hypothetical protein
MVAVGSRRGPGCYHAPEMPTLRPGAQAIAGAGAPPADRETLLEQVGVERRQLYRLVREIVDALDAAAPWSLLYCPPEDQAELLALGESLVVVVQGTKHSRVPLSMVHATQPFLFEILNTLVPQLEVAAGIGAIPGDARQKLVANCMALCSPELGPEQMVSTVPLALNRVLRLIEALTSLTAGQVRQLRQELGEPG